MSRPTSRPSETDADEVRRREQPAWSWYDWANSAYYTTILSVLFAPYLIGVARAAAPACGSPGCVQKVQVLGLGVAAGALPGYLTGFATVAGALVLPVVGVLVDRSSRKRLHMGLYAWTGSAFAALLFWVRGDDWVLGAVAVFVSSVLAGCSLVAYNAILVDISTEAERDRVSAQGWAWGYLGGGLLLALDLVVVLAHAPLGLTEAFAVRLAMLSAAVWWAGFTLVPFLRLRDRPARLVGGGRSGSAARQGFGQLATTLRELRAYPMTVTFLVAYLFYNDGIQTVIATASTYGAEELHLDQSVLIATILLVQFVAYVGARLFGRLAGRTGAYRMILVGVGLWVVVVLFAYLLPARNVPFFVVLGVCIAVVLGGTQALSRSFFSLLIPRGREGEYFSLYQACERGTSWLGQVLFATVYAVTGSYRPAIVALLVFFVLGGAVLLRVDAPRGIREAGNTVPADAPRATGP